MNPEYIAQCAAAIEVREAILDSLKLGSVVRFYDPLSKEVMHDIIGDSVADLPERQIEGFRKSPELVILSTQEQLWAMLPDDIEVALERRGRCYWTVFPRGYKGDSPGGSNAPEESLLKLVMLVNHNKRWNLQKGAWV